MIGLNIRGTLLGSCAVAALALGASNGAQAQITTTISGGGSTLAGPTYQVLFANDQQNLDTNFGFLYANVGSGAGARGVLCNDGSQVPVNGTNPPTVHYGASDNPLTPAQISAWSANTAQAGCAVQGGGQTLGGKLIQIPTVGTPVAIAYDTPKQTGNGQLTFTDDQLCRIFSGLVTNWGDASLTSIAPAAKRPTGAITVIYRSDGSGTSALFKWDVNRVCTPSNTLAGVTFPVGGTQTFVQVFPGATVPASLASTFIGANGSGGVSTAIGINAGYNGGGVVSTGGHSGSVGFISPDYTAIASGQYQNYNRFLQVAAVVNHVNGTTYLPTGPNTATALATIPLPTTLTDASQYLQTNPDPNVGYPVVGFTTMILPQCYADNNVAFALQDFLNAIFSNVSFQSNVLAAGFVNLPDNLTAVLQNNILNNFGSNAVDIQNADLCQANGGATYPGR